MQPLPLLTGSQGVMAGLLFDRNLLCVRQSSNLPILQHAVMRPAAVVMPHGVQAMSGSAGVALTVDSKDALDAINYMAQVRCGHPPRAALPCPAVSCHSRRAGGLQVACRWRWRPMKSFRLRSSSS